MSATKNDARSYPIETAQERFFIWAAYRATQAGSAKANRDRLIPALRNCGVIESLKDPKNYTWDASQYDVEFDKWVTQARRRLRGKTKKAVTHGIAAKLIATYVKGMFLVGRFSGTQLEQHLMPPIDSELLKGLDAAHDTKLAKKYSWQNLSRGRFKTLIRKLRKLKEQHDYAACWELEKHWDLEARLKQH